MTFKELKEQVARLGIVVRKKDGEYRVNIRGGSEATAYYTDDIEDALETAKAMARGK